MIGVWLAALAAASFWGGWEWALPCVALAAALRRIPGPAAAAAVLPGLFWLAAFAVTGDRRLFFCYFMQYAVHLACLHGACAGVTGVAVFLAIRVGQGASVDVLAVEAMVALAVVLAAVKVQDPGPRSARRRMAIASVASLVAFAGLAL
ncbi:MAG: hypothetical protein ABI806_20510 [Candidatus Solibacter sp.]